MEDEVSLVASMEVFGIQLHPAALDAVQGTVWPFVVSVDPLALPASVIGVGLWGVEPHHSDWHPMCWKHGPVLRVPELEAQEYSPPVAQWVGPQWSLLGKPYFHLEK